ncbi:lysylphosphatidylglycerol synthase transmembrane domain-containing protein [Litoreibacter ponti]|nr:lysylphosphatidylglycerol synthase transmembrane domain-containing protein [Litoreibacter ponti]
MADVTPSPVAPPAGAPRRFWRDRAVLYGLLALFAVGLAGLISATGWEETWAELKKITALQFIGLLSLSLINYLIRGARWHLLSRELGLRLALRHSVLHFVGGFAMTITPGRIGELVRLRWITRMSGWRVERITPLPLADRAFDMAAMGCVLGGAVFLSQAGGISAIPVAALAVGTAIIVTRPTLLVKLVEGAFALLRRFPRPFARLRQAARSMGVFSPLRVSGPALVLSCIGWIAEGIALFLLLQWMGADITLATATTIFLFSTLAGGLTGAPGGLGGAEAAMMVLLTMNGVELSQALAATTVIRITTLWYAIGLGMLAFPVAETLSRKART